MSILGYVLEKELFKGKQIMELYRTVERLPFFERKKKLFESRERGHLLFPKGGELYLKPCNLPLYTVVLASNVIKTKEELDVLRRLVYEAIRNTYTSRKGVGTLGRDERERVNANHQLITEELVDSIIYCVATGHDLGCIDHNLTWLFYGTTFDGDYFVDPKELYQEIPRITIE